VCSWNGRLAFLGFGTSSCVLLLTTGHSSTSGPSGGLQRNPKTVPKILNIIVIYIIVAQMSALHSNARHIFPDAWREYFIVARTQPAWSLPCLVNRTGNPRQPPLGSVYAAFDRLGYTSTLFDH